MGTLGVADSHSQPCSSNLYICPGSRTLQKCGTTTEHVEPIFWYRDSLLIGCVKSFQLQNVRSIACVESFQLQNFLSLPKVSPGKSRKFQLISKVSLSLPKVSPGNFRISSVSVPTKSVSRKLQKISKVFPIVITY